MTDNHTNGPWDVTKAKPRKVTANGILICTALLRNMGTTAQNKHGKSVNEALANAKLIAAAPDLLEALRNIAAAYENQNLIHVDFRVEAKRVADAAIAKATG
jgi:hypothetical protein